MQDATKGVCKKMASPTKGSWKRLKKAGRCEKSVFLHILFIFHIPFLFSIFVFFFNIPLYSSSFSTYSSSFLFNIFLFFSFQRQVFERLGERDVGDEIVER